jgi:hypothetical protein
MSLRPMKPIIKPHTKPIIDEPSLEERHPQLKEILNIVCDDVCVFLGEDYSFSSLKSKGEHTTIISGKEGYMRLGIYPSLINELPHFRLGTLFIREKYRGKRFGKKMMMGLISSLYEIEWNTNDNKFSGRFGLILQPSCLDYGENSHIQNKSFKKTLFSMMKDNFISKKENIGSLDGFFQSVEESIELYENTPNKIRKKRFKKNSKRLINYYSKFGFRFYDTKYMTLDLNYIKVSKNYN